MKKRNKKSFIEWFIVTITYLFCVVLSIFTSSILGVLILFISNYINTYIHEIGHALAGKLVNLKVRSITIGDGKELWEKKI